MAVSFSWGKLTSAGYFTPPQPSDFLGSFCLIIWLWLDSYSSLHVCSCFSFGERSMKPLNHARASVKRYGGSIEDYMDIHTFIDGPKSSFADVRHRAILHNAYGCFLVEQMFGPYRYNSSGKMYCPRQIAEDHVVEDLGRIPSVEEWLKDLPVKNWMDVKTVYRKRVQNVED